MRTKNWRFSVGVIAVTMGASAAMAQSVAQGPIVNPANGHAYYRLTNSNWTNARSVAVALGGDLVTINDAAENAFVLNTFANAAGVGRVWVGFNAVAAAGTFVWANGETPGFTNWDSGEPNNTSTERWTCMYSGNGRWNNVTDDANPFGIGNVYGVVEVVIPSVTRGPISNSANCHAYYLLGNSNWTSAEVAAQVLGGHLVTIDDLDENTFVLNTFANPAGRVWLGLNDAAASGTFVWSGGSPAGFTNWDSGEPNNIGTEHWALMYSGNGRWNNVLNQANPFGIGEVYGLVEVSAVLNDECSSPLGINAGATTVCTRVATNSAPATETGCAAVPRTFNKDLWYQYSPVTSGVFTVTTCDAGTTFDTILAAYNACPGAPGFALTCNDDACGADGLRSSIRVAGAAGQAYLIRIGDFNADGGTAVITIYCPADYNQSGAVSVQDIFDFLAGYFSNDSRADINGSGAVSVQDIFDFLAAYFAGC